MNILLILGECNKNYRRVSRYYIELYRNLSARQVISIERRARRNTLYHQKQVNRLPNNNDPRLLIILGMIHFNLHISIRQIEISRATAHRMLIRIISSLSHQSTGIE